MRSDNTQRSPWPRLVRLAAGYAAALLLTGVTWDLAGSFQTLPAWWPTVSYVCVAIGSAAALMAVFVRIMSVPAAVRAPGLTLLQLIALGVVVGAWALRGDAEIATDPPLVYAQLVGVLVYLLAGTRMTDPQSAPPQQAVTSSTSGGAITD